MDRLLPRDEPNTAAFADSAALVWKGSAAPTCACCLCPSPHHSAPSSSIPLTASPHSLSSCVAPIPLFWTPSAPPVLPQVAQGPAGTTAPGALWAGQKEELWALQEACGRSWHGNKAALSHILLFFRTKHPFALLK